MLQYYPASYAALAGVVSLVVFILARDLYIGARNRLLKAATADVEHSDAILRAMVWRQFLNGAIQGALGAARIGVVIATLGVIVHAFTMTGLAGRVVHLLSDLSGDNTLYALFVVAGISMLFGLGVPSAGSYVIVAILGAPILVGLDIPVVAAHLFILYFTMLSGLTPPVGATVIVTAQIAQSSYVRSALEAMSLALPGFVVPFLYVYQPAILGIGDTMTIMWVSASVILGVYALSATLEAQHLRRLGLWERGAMGAAAIAFLVAGIWGVWLAFIALAILAGLTALHLRTTARQANSGRATL